MTKYHYHDNLTEADMDNMMVYRLTIEYNAMYVKNVDPIDTHIHYYESPNGQILIDILQAMINDYLYIEKIEIEKV